MTEAVIRCFKNNRFFQTLDFQPRPHNGGFLPHSRIAKKTFAADQRTVTVEEDDYSTPVPHIGYGFSNSPEKYIVFYMDPGSGKCIAISGDDRAYTGIRPRSLRSTHPEKGQPMDQDSMDSILDDFLTGLRNVYTGQAFDKLVQDTLQKLPFLFAPNPGMPQPSPGSP